MRDLDKKSTLEYIFTTYYWSYVLQWEEYKKTTTKMCIKSEPYIYQKSANWVLNVGFLCIDADDAL